MASTASTQELRILPTGHIAGAKKFAWGVNTLDASGLLTLDTGLSRVDSVVTGGVSGATAVGLFVDVSDDVPTANGTLHFRGYIGTVSTGHVTAANAQQFSWHAIGE